MSVLEHNEKSDNLFKEIMQTVENFAKDNPTMNMLDVLTTAALVIRFVIETNFPKEKWLSSFDVYAKSIHAEIENSKYFERPNVLS
jgi:hypothetical protein